MKLIKIGKIVTTHGIKGEIKILSNFELKTEAFKIGNNIYIGENKIEETINSYRVHKNYDMITLKGYNNINEVLKYLKQNVYIDRNIIKSNEIVLDDLIGMCVIIDHKIIGKVISYNRIKNNPILEINYNNKTIYIPYNKDLIENINVDDKTITIKNIEGLIQ